MGAQLGRGFSRTLSYDPSASGRTSSSAYAEPDTRFFVLRSSMNLPKRMGMAFFIWVVVSLVLVSAWGWDQARAFVAEWPRAFLLPTWLALSLYGASCDTRTSSSGGKKEIRRHRTVLWMMLTLLL